MKRKTQAVFGAMMISLLGAGASAEPFTYQGQLFDGGQPADGLYDITLRIMNTPVGGSVIGSGFTFTDVLVTDGVFQVEYDPGDIFDGSDVWLDVAVSNGGAPVTLAPRSRITPTPTAQHATTSDFALNVPWTEAPGIITYGDGNDRVFVNRSGPITGAEYFGVHGDVAGFAGMYVSGPANSQPFYGYSVDGTANAFHYYNAVSDSWILFSNGQTVMEVDSVGDVNIYNDAIADDFKFTSPKTRRVAISGDVFHSANNSNFIGGVLGFTGSYITDTGLGWLVAPVNLPDGAVFQRMTVYCSDTAAGSLSITLNTQIHNSTSSTSVFNVSSASTSGSSLTLVDTTPTASVSVVDYASRHYSLLVSSSNWPGNNTLGIGSVVIEYTIDEAN